MDTEIFATETMQLFYELTGISVNWTSLSTTPLVFTTLGFELAELKNYFDFDEIIKFINTQYETTNIYSDIFHTYYTQSRLIYNIMFTDLTTKNIGAFITGPVILNPLNEYDFDRILQDKQFHLSEKQLLMKAFSKAIVVTESQITNLGKLMAALIHSPTAADWHTITQRIHGNEKHDFSEVYSTITNNVWHEYPDIEDINYENSLEIGNAIVNGNVKAIGELLNEKNSFFSRRLPSFDDLYKLKYECIKISALSCSCAIEGKAPYDQALSILDKSISEIEKVQTTNDMINLIKTTLETYAYIVSVSYNGTYSKHINSIINYIQANYNKALTLEILAEHVQLNPSYLSNLIKRETNSSLNDIINNIRIEKGKFLLINSNMTIHQIAQAVGFNYQNYFSAVFRKFVGITPKEYRMSNGKTI